VAEAGKLVFWPGDDSFLSLVRQMMPDGSRSHIRTDPLIQVQLDLSGLKIHVVHENQSVAALEISMSINFIFPGITQNWFLPIEESFILFGQLLNPRQEGNVMIVKAIKVVLDLRE